MEQINPSSVLSLDSTRGCVSTEHNSHYANYSLLYKLNQLIGIDLWNK